MSTALRADARVLPPNRLMRTPREVDIDITARCNLHCRYCYFFDDGAQTYDELPTTAWVRFFDECGKLGVMRTTIAGGEPFVRQDLFNIIDSVVRNRMRFCILSNGTLITEGIAARLADSGRCDYVQVSIDGSCPRIHDSLRGQGSFAAAVQGIEALMKAGVEASARLTVHRHNVDDLEAAVAFLLDTLGIGSMTVNAAGYMGTCRTTAPDILLTTPMRERAMRDLARLEQRYTGRLAAQAGPLSEIHLWNDMLDASRRSAAPFPDGGRLTGCRCTFDRISVRSDGVYVPCCMLPSVELGHMGCDPLDRIWQESPQLNRMRSRASVSLRDFDMCRECAYVDYCTGNCPALALNLTGRIDHPSPDACLRAYLADGGVVPPVPAEEL